MNFHEIILYFQRESGVCGVLLEVAGRHKMRVDRLTLILQHKVGPRNLWGSTTFTVIHVDHFSLFRFGASFGLCFAR